MDGPGHGDADGHDDEIKSPDIDGLRQEIIRLNKQVVELQQIVQNLKAKIGIDVVDEEKKEMDTGFGVNQTIIEMLKETKKEIELLKNSGNIRDKDGKDKKLHPVEIWLKDVVKLPEYYPLFEENGFDDMNVVKMLNMQQMEKLGINKLGHQLKIMGAVENLKQDNHTFDGDKMNQEGFYPSPGNSNYL